MEAAERMLEARFGEGRWIMYGTLNSAGNRQDRWKGAADPGEEKETGDYFFFLEAVWRCTPDALLREERRERGGW